MAKIEAEELEQISISNLKDQGYFQNGVAPLIKGISFTTSKCNLGGNRFWFVCKCGNKVGVLYVLGDEFRCRKCLNLAYHSQNLSKSVRNDVLLSALDSFIEAQELQEQVKRITYSGELTKKQRQVERLYFKFLQVANML